MTLEIREYFAINNYRKLSIGAGFCFFLRPFGVVFLDAFGLAGAAFAGTFAGSTKPVAFLSAISA